MEISEEKGKIHLSLMKFLNVAPNILKNPIGGFLKTVTILKGFRATKKVEKFRSHKSKGIP